MVNDSFIINLHVLLIPYMIINTFEILLVFSRIGDKNKIHTCYNKIQLPNGLYFTYEASPSYGKKS